MPCMDVLAASMTAIQRSLCDSSAVQSAQYLIEGHPVAAGASYASLTNGPAAGGTQASRYLVHRSHLWHAARVHLQAWTLTSTADHLARVSVRFASSSRYRHDVQQETWLVAAGEQLHTTPHGSSSLVTVAS